MTTSHPDETEVLFAEVLFTLVLLTEVLFALVLFAEVLFVASHMHASNVPDALHVCVPFEPSGHVQSRVRPWMHFSTLLLSLFEAGPQPVDKRAPARARGRI